MEIFVALLVIYVLYAFFKKKDKKMLKNRNKKTYFEPDFQVTMSYGSYNETPKSKNKEKGRWIASNETIIVGKHTISGGHFYSGGILAGRYEGDIESSLVDNTLQIANADYTFQDTSLGYWASYNALSPKCRGAYLEWLKSDRDMADVPIGYLFIYFYGLERRVLLDYDDGDVEDCELQEICNEILRLQEIFKDNYSFSSYSTQLLNYIAIQHPDVTDISNRLNSNSLSSDFFRIKLAETVTNGLPIDAELALTWIYDHPDHNLRTPSRRCANEYKELFKIKYKRKFPDGIIVKPNKTVLKLHYNPANKSLNYREYGPSDLCDPSVLSAPVNKIAKIAYECTEELDALSRYLGRKDNSKDDVSALLLLPDELLNAVNHPIITKFKDTAQKQLSNNEGVIPVQEVWAHTGLEQPSKFNKKQIEIVEGLINKAGYGFAPSSNLHGVKIKFDDVMIIHKPFEDNIENTPVFDDTAIKLRLGSIVAHADLNIHDSEKTFLNEIIYSNDNLTSLEKSSLEVFLKWLLISPATFNGVKSSLSSLRDKDTEVVRRMLINTALSDGKIDPEEVKNIEKLYTTLGLNKADVPGDIHAVSSNSKINTGSKSSEPSKVILNEMQLKRHETSTQDAKEILNKIFEDEEDEEIIIEDDSDQIESVAVTLYKQIISQKISSLDEFEKLCNKHDFFPQAAIDSINEWSFEKVNAPVVELDDGVVIDDEIAEELEEFV